MKKYIKYKNINKIMNNKFLTLFIFIFVLSSSFSTGMIIPIKTTIENLETDNHQPICIIGNNEFTEENGVIGGSGTEEDPYIIENWWIVSDGIASQGIFINNTDVHFIIRNCTISGFHHPDEYHQGIELSDVVHGKIESTIISECQTGISVRYSKENIIENCTCFNYPARYGYGIGILLSNNITIISCRCYDMYTGIDISKSSDITIKKTECFNNTNNGLDSFAVEPTSMRFFIENCTFQKNNDYGIHLIDRVQHPSYFTIRNCSFNSNEIGMSLERLCDNLIENCVFYNNSIGLSLDDRAKDNIIRNCSFLSHTHYGILIQGAFILLHFAPNNEVYFCDFIENKCGLFLFGTRGTKMHHCRFINNSFFGVCSAFSSPQITLNNFFNNGRECPENGSCGALIWGAFTDLRNNYWGDSEGPSISFIVRSTNYIAKLILIRTIDDSDTIIFQGVFGRCVSRFRPWLSEPVPDAGRQT